MIPSSALLFAILSATPGPGVDFFYFEGDPVREQIDVNFGLHAECREKGISMFASEGVMLTAVRADGKDVERMTSSGIRHGAGVTIIEHPGASFFYRMPLTRLRSDDRYDPAQPLSFSDISYAVVGLPRRLEITYRLRCANGSLSREYVTRGKRYPVPRRIKGSGE